MDPDAPQPSEPVAPPEEPDEDASGGIAPPPEQATQTQQGDAPQAPTQTDVPQVPPPEPSDEDTTFLPSGEPNEPLLPVPDASAPAADIPPVIPDTLAPIAPPNLEVEETPTTAADTDIVLPASIAQIAPARSRAGMADLEPLSAAKRREKKEAKKSRILAYAQEKGHFKIRDIELHFLIPKRTAEEYLKELIAAGHLERRGDVDSTEYWWLG